MHTPSTLGLLAFVTLATSMCVEHEPGAARLDRITTSTDGAPTVEARARLRLSGRMEGRLEPCGCASGQVGGLARRTFRNKLDRSYDFLIEGGDLVTGGTPLDDLKLMTALSVLADPQASYDVVALGRTDLALPVDVLQGYLDVFGSGGLPFVASDVVSAGDETFAVRAFVDLSSDTARARVASLLGKLPEGEDAERFGFELREPEAAWRHAMQDVAPDAIRVLLVHDDTKTARRAAGFEPRPDLIVAIDPSHLEPPRAAEIVDGVPLVHPGIRGRFLLDVTVERTADGPRLTEYEAFPLAGADSSDLGGEDETTRQQILQHRQDVADAGILAEMAERRPTATGASYVGSERCMPCHQDAYRVWKASRHGRAWQTLEQAESGERYGWPVTKYPDCVACHTVGYGEVSGFVGPEATPDLRGVGCEECHGPGGDHVLDPANKKLPATQREDCRPCHDFEQSPLWDYDARWKTIEHK